MDFLLLRIFPAALLLGGLGLGFAELRFYLQERPQASRGRLGRRLAGALLLILLAVMVTQGRIPDRQSMPTEELWVYFRHWLYVMAVAFVLMLVAAWDALVGVRQLRGFFEGVEREEIARIQQHLTRSGQ